MKFSFKKLALIGLPVLALVSFAFIDSALAQDVASNLGTVGEQSGLGNADIRLVIARIIRAFLGVIGIITVVLVMYGGFMWMTAGGNAERVEKAKRLLIQAVIGLIIIMSSLAITQFVMNALTDATGTSIDGSGGSGNTYIPPIGGATTTSFVVTGFNPEGAVPIRNVVGQLTFSRPVDEETVNNAISVGNLDTQLPVDVTTTVRGNRVEIRPSAACPAPNDDRNCFDANTNLRVTVQGTIESTLGQPIVCSAIHPCSFTFATGELVDTDAPNVNFTVPNNNQRFAPESFIDVQARASDDSFLAAADFSAENEVFDAVPATGDNLADVIFDSVWNNAGFPGDSAYELSVTATDIAGNTDTDTLFVRLNPAHCYNGTFDDGLGETGLDCGGACGACTGGSCTDDSECSSGSCINNVCIALPVIENVAPAGGAPGTFVLLEGQFFGSSGQVLFPSTDGGTVAAEIPVCTDGWSSTAVTVQVPANAADGPLTITTGGLTETTDDSNGPIIDDFDVNDVVRPNLCRVSPNSGRARARVNVIGSQFGDAKEDESVVLFDLSDEFLFDETEPNSYESWSDESIAITVPGLADDNYLVSVTVGGVTSNPIPFFVRNGGNSEVNTPQIQGINPESGAIGSYATLNGSDFGNRTGTVRFENTRTGYSGIASVEFPEACQAGFWTDDQVVVIVPSQYDNGLTVTPDQHNVYITTADGGISNSVAFQVLAGDPDPGICAIDPDRAEAGNQVTVHGDNFGSDQGVLTFFNEIDAIITTWTDNRIVATVPPGQTGPVYAANSAGTESNRINFEFGSAGEDVVTAVLADGGYGWTFSTGEIPEVPALVVACQDGLISAVPNSTFTDQTCSNVLVRAQFTTLMNHATLRAGESVLIQECLNARCSNVSDPLIAPLRISDTSDFTYFEASPFENTPMAADTTYRVTVTTDAQSADGIAFAQDAFWEFTTGPADFVCDVRDVYVAPSEEVLTFEGETSEFHTYGTDGACLILSNDLDWNWSIDESIARIQPGQCTQDTRDECALVTALSQGITDVTAQDRATGISDSAELTITFEDPYVEQYWPLCNSACLNGLVGGRFNIPVRLTSGGSGIEYAKNVIVEECTNELCASTTRTVANSARCIASEETANGQVGCVEFAANLDVNQLSPDAYYKVTVSGRVQSREAKPLTRLNTPEGFVWTFGTGGEVCSVSYVDIAPDQKIVNSVGDRQVYTVRPFSEPDECSVAGQRLDASTYDWSWAVSNDPSLHGNGDPTIATLVRVGGGLIESRSVTGPGCTASCTPIGSFSVDAICGNGVIEFGEECEDGNIAGGDGCSASCLREGIVKDAEALCGNGTLDRAPSGAGEDCDDGNNISGDGCSAVCLNEGSNAVGAQCGNGDLAYDQNIGGEDCDDGNKVNGDGCSASCTFEGSLSSAEAPAVCGDRFIKAPYESCDDGNLNNGDGCSASCVREGFAAIPGAICGDGNIAQNQFGGGEDCDDGNTVNGDGCSSICTFEGSSLYYNTPSVCGDGLVGQGEYAACEAGQNGDGNIDPTQIAEIADTAPLAVDENTNLAQAVITATVNEGTGVSDSSIFGLYCGAESDLDCSNPSEEGVTTNGCCAPRPVIDSMQPSGNAVCRNAAISFTTDQEIDTDTYAGNVFVVLDTATTNGECPAGHRILSESDLAGGGSFFARLWEGIRNFFIPNATARTTGACALEIQSIQSIPEEVQEGGDQLFRNVLTYGVALEPNANYTIFVEGDANIADDNLEGIAAISGARMSGLQRQSFTTGSEICAVDRVTVEDTTGNPPFFFGTFRESHQFAGRVFTISGGVQSEIQSIPNVYEWTWDPWQEDSEGIIVDVESGQNIDGQAVDGSFAVVTSKEETGRANVVAQVAIVENGELTGTVASAERVSTFVCENPWPTFDYFPFIDDETGTQPGIERGAGWLNFSTFYCRDAGAAGFDDDLPALNVILPEDPGPSDILKEYLFEVDNASGDAIGIRVATNPNYLSPRAWYEAQGFVGNPTDVDLGNVYGIQDGRSLYVAAPNKTDGGQIYSNIYILTYNELASQETTNILDQMIDNFELSTNVMSVGFCMTGPGRYTDQTCSSDLDCSADQQCGDLRAQLHRDTKRLSDLVTIGAAIEEFGSSNGFCSETTSLACTSSVTCPGNEVCVPAVPRLDSGTFIQSGVASAWESWDTAFASQLSAAPKDPINSYGNLCPDENGQPGDCRDESRGVYFCPVGAYSYHYRSIGLFDYEVMAELEYDYGNWANPLPQFETGALIAGGNDTASPAGFNGGPYLCADRTLGASAVCGDGVVGEDEVCEPGQAGPRIACDINGVAGSISQICNSSCSGFETPAGAACTVLSCGNGVVEAGEECDDGVNNGQYGFCGADCSFASANYCGDGEISAGEVCDCGTGDAAGSGVTVSGDACSRGNGEYRVNVGRGCAWDCSGDGPFCGDKIIQSGEQCDGNAESYAGALCSDGSQCTTDADCDSGACGAGGLACQQQRVCVQGDPSKLGFACSQDNNCNSPSGVNAPAVNDGLCSTTPVQQFRTRTCAPAGSGPQNSCTFQQEWTALNCRATVQCGNGILEAGEACDDGNTDNTDACTNRCELNVCGDDFLYAGVEQCDAGDQNGVPCQAGYGSICTYCTNSCRFVTASGDFCGDGQIQAAEICDGATLRQTLVEVELGSNGVRDVEGYCEFTDPVEYNTQGNDDSLLCVETGICNGGSENGELCYLNDAQFGTINARMGSGTTNACSSGGGVCVQPTCSGDCQSTCPFVFDTASVQLQSNRVGSARSTTLTLINEEVADSATGNSRSGTMYIPACRAASALIADVDYNVTPLDTRVVFISDLSNSMNGNAGNSNLSRIEVVQNSLNAGISRLFEELPSDKVQVGLVGFGGRGNEPEATRFPYDQDEDDDGVTDNTSNLNKVRWMDFSANIPLLSTEIATYDDIAYGGTYTWQGMRAAEQMLGAFGEDTRKIAVLMADGAWQGDFDPSYDACVMKRRGIEVYTLGIVGGTPSLTPSVSDCDAVQNNDGTMRTYDEWRVMEVLSRSNVKKSKQPFLNHFVRLSSPILNIFLKTNPVFAACEYSPGRDFSNINSLSCWSSGNPNQNTGLDYAFNGTTEADIAEAYENIIDSIVGATLSYTVNQGGTVTRVGGPLPQGNGIEIPWPEGFECNSFAEQALPITVGFQGANDGDSITISNVRFAHCAP